MKMGLWAEWVVDRGRQEVPAIGCRLLDRA